MILKLFPQENSDLHNFLQVDCANNKVLHSNLVGYKTFFESGSLKAPARCETNINESIGSSSLRVMLNQFLRPPQFARFVQKFF